MAFGFLKKAIKTAGKGISGVGKGFGKVGNLLGKVPVVGAGLKGVFTITTSGPFMVAGDIAAGKRIDKVALSHLKRQIGAVKDVAPYAQMVVSAVPGVGQGISAGIAGGLALAQGQPLSEAIVAAVKSSLPGGPLAQTVFNVTQATVSGKPVDQALIAGIPLDAMQKKALSAVIGTAKAIASGQRVDTALADNALKTLPTDVQKAVNISIAIAEGQKLQSIAARNVNPAALNKLVKEGVAISKVNPVIKAGAGVIKNIQGKQGFAVGAGIMNHTVSPMALTAVRAKLKPDQRRGFDIAVSTHIGLATKTPPKTMTPAQQFGYAVTKGLTGASPQLRANVLGVVGKDATAKTGAIVAINTMKKPLWKRMLNAVGITRFGDDSFGENDYGTESWLN